MKLNLKCKNGDIGHRVRKVGNNRVRKEKDLIKRKTRGYIEHKARETQESIGHDVGHKSTVDTRASRARGTCGTKAHRVRDT